MRATKRRGERTLGRINARLFPNGQTITQPGGELFYLPPDPHFFGYLVGHEPHVGDLIELLVKPGDTVLDIGANIGYFAVQMAHRAGVAGRVFAYEIDKKNLASLARNRDLADRQGGCIEIVPAAVSDIAGTVAMIAGAQSTHHRVSHDQGPALSVPAVSIDGEIVRHGIIDPISLVKIDVEGHETFVLKGMARAVREGKVRAVVLEVLPGEVHAQAIADQLDAWRGQIASVKAWIDGSWRETAVRNLAWQTDCLVTFL